MKRMALVLVLVLAMVAPSFAQEPLEIGVTQEGQLKNSVATYTFNASAQQVIVFNLDSDDFDPYLQVEAADGDVLVSDDDGGDGLNARVVFVAPEAAEFSVVVRSYGGNATGSYVLTSTDDVAQLAFGEPVEVVLEEGSSVQTFFIAEEGDVINLTATAADEDVDTNLTLVGPDGSQVDYSEDFNGLNPAITRMVLPQTGMYSVTLAPYNSDDFGDVTLLLEKTELPLLSADATVLKFTDSYAREVIGLDVVEGALYQLTFSFDKESSGSVEMNGTGGSYTSYAYFSFSSVEGASYLYRAKETGLSRIKVTSSSYDLPIEFSITAVVVEE